MRRAGFVFVVLALGCGARASVQAPRPEPLPSAPVVSVADAGAPRNPACLDAFDAGKSVDSAALEAARAMAEPERSFRVGRAYFSSDHWVEAATAFRSVAFDHPDSEMGVSAAKLYLECLNQLASKAHRAVCYDEDFPREVSRLVDLYCTTRRSKNEEACNLFDRIQMDLERLRAENLTKASYQAGARAYLALLRQRCLPPGSPLMRCDEIAYNAGAAFLAAGDEPAAQGVRALMIDPKNGMDKSPLTTKLSCRVDHSTSPACR